MNLTNLTTQQRADYTALSLSEKVDWAKQIISRALRRHPPAETAVAWTGGKDSMVLLWLVKAVCNEAGWTLPTVLLIDEGDQFSEVQKFCQKLEQQWDLPLVAIRNAAVLSQTKVLGESVQVATLPAEQQAELKKIGFTADSFPFEPESFVGNHLMKTVPLNRYITEHEVKAVVTGVRWDEQAARATDDFQRELTDPPHARIEPILHLTERDIWQLIKQHNIPYVSLYEQGYRSLGARTSTSKTSDLPAWQQDLEGTTERAGRQQDKEKIMERLRDLGYM